MTDTTMHSLLALLAIVVMLLCFYIVRGKRAMKRNPDAYIWQPEQDYDVVMQGETPMTPGFPVLRKRKKTQKSQ